MAQQPIPYQEALERRYRGEHPIRTLLYFYKGDIRKLAWALGFYVIKHSGVWALPLLTANVIDVVSNPDTRSLSELWLYAFFLVVIFVQNIPTNSIYVHFLSSANRNMELKLRSTLTRRLQHLSINFYHRNSTGALQTKLLRDVEMIEQVTRQLFEVIPVAMITILIAVVVTMIRAPWFLAFFLITVPLTVALMMWMRSPLKRHNHDFRVELEGMSSRLNEMINLIPVTRAHGVEADEIRQIEEKLQRVRSAGKRLDAVTAVYGASAWVSYQLANTACLVIAGYAAYRGLFDVSVGDVVLLTSYFNNLTNAISQIITMLPQISKGLESVSSLADVIESPDLEHNEGKSPVDSVRGHFVFEQVSFAYPNTDTSSLHDLSLEVQPGETIAIIGPSGSGKTTLLNLIIGFIRPSAGRILLDGENINDLDLRTYRHYLSVVPQNTVLFAGTVRDNIVYGSQDVTVERLRQALIDANALHFVEQLPKGLDTLIGENGLRLSGGQRQRLAIARALIRDPRVLILDEATSALDTESEAQIQEAMERLMKGRTTFVVAHRLSTIKNAHRIIVLERGRIVEIGTHDDLLRRRGAYYRLRAAADSLV
jgi:ATP-binding cassette subfamily B protein